MIYLTNIPLLMFDSHEHVQYHSDVTNRNVTFLYQDNLTDNALNVILGGHVVSISCKICIRCGCEL